MDWSNMFIEKKRIGISPRLLTANATGGGIVSVANICDLFVKQKIFIVSNTQGPLLVEIKRFISLTSFYVGPPGPIQGRTDLSAYLLADAASISAELQDRPGITLQEHERAVYAEEPIVAKRTISVDKYGRYYTTENPFPVRLSDGSINIGTVNAELEVQLSHKDDDPDVGDVHDSVRIGNGTYTMEVNPDGSINVVLASDSAKTLNIDNISLVLANTEYAVTLPDGTKRFTLGLRDGKGPLRLYDASGALPFRTISRGAIYESGSVVVPNGFQIFVQSGQAGSVLEVLSWTNP